MDLQLQNKRVLVCGASDGIGAAVAEAFAAEGADLLLVARRTEKLATLTQQLSQSYGITAHPITADLATAAGIETVLDAVQQHCSGVDVLITNTGGPPAGKFLDHSVDTWITQGENLLLSVVRLVKGLTPNMQAQQSGAILMLTSVAAKEPNANLILSNTYRAGLLGLSKTLSQELGPDNIRVNCLLPGYTETDRIKELAQKQAEQHGVSQQTILERFAATPPLKRMAEPAEIAKVAVFLCSDAASYVTGTAMAVDGGRSAGIL